MDKEVKETPKKQSEKKQKNKINPKKPASTKGCKIPVNLQGIHFDDISGWLNGYRSYNAQTVARAVIMAFRKRYFLSQVDAAAKLGISTPTLARWEAGKSKIRWKSRNELCSSGWFKPQHFGLDVPASDFTDELPEA
jgi:DNA-binding XRE family transcriptional regulator